MQALNVKSVVEPQLVNEIYEPPLNQKIKPVKVQEATILSLEKNKNMRRILEAYSDCV